MKGIASAFALALLAGAGGPEPLEYRHARINIVVVAPSQPAFQEYRSPPNSDCAPDRGGEYRTHGNRWFRDGNICVDRVEVSFHAFPDPPSLHYGIQADRCPDLGHSSSFRMPGNLFERPVPEQIGMLKSALADDLREFGRRCGIRLDPAPFIDERFDRFYADYGDGWWFDRLDGGFRLTPNVTSAAAGAAAD